MKAYYLEEEQSMVVDLVCDIVEGEIKDRSEEVDHQGTYPAEGIEILAQSGLTACAVAEEAGGAGLDAWSQTVVIEKTATACASTALAVANIAEAAELIEKYGSERAKEEILPELVAGTYAFVAGSDANVMTTFKVSATITEQEDSYVINGAKKWIQSSGAEEFYVLAADAGDRILWAVVKSSAPGITVAKKSKMLGMKGMDFVDLSFDSCVISKDMVLSGDVRKEHEEIGSLYMAAIASGIAQGSLDVAIAYVNERVQFGKTIAQFENTQHTAAELLASTEAARALVWEAANIKAKGQDFGYTAALAKLAACKNASVTSRKCVQFMGGYGYSREYPIERKMRDAKMTEILGGASSFEKNLIAMASVLMQ